MLPQGRMRFQLNFCSHVAKESAVLEQSLALHFSLRVYRCSPFLTQGLNVESFP